ncbi:outer membrane protein [Thalassospira povalilytica]|uniref:outer membrane protein n=1 Tax=Thalassospira povalilytica TaxID=732237 RepID=UPI003AA8F516
MLPFLQLPKTHKPGRKAARIPIFATLGVFALTTTATAEEWLLTPYLRADLGYSSTIDDDADSTDSIRDTWDTDPHTGTRYQAGAGLKLNNYLRTDLTISYRDNMANMDSFTFNNNTGSTRQATGGRHNTSNVTTMLTGYIDPLAAYGINTGAFSPYIQAGIGWAHNSTKSTGIGGTTNTIDGAQHDDVAWQAGAGLNYALTDHWKIDFSYRYINMGEARASKHFTSGSVPNGRLRQELRYDLHAHEVMLGLQYQF